MCNLYSVRTNHKILSQVFRAMDDRIGNHIPQSPILPDRFAPVVRLAANGGRELEPMLWGFPPPASAGSGLVTNVRNTSSSYWAPWLAQGYRCLAPATSYCEFDDSPPKTPNWFALGADRPPFAFAGIWCP